MLIARLFIIILSIFVVADASALDCFKSPNDTNIRVAIARTSGELAVKGRMEITLPLREEQMITADSAFIKPKPNGFEINQQFYAVSFFSISGSSLKFNGRTYHGTLQFHKDSPSSILVVNHVPLEEYLVGILASEMPLDWPIEALKAQAVAARTYAIFQINSHRAKGADYQFDIESTTMDQVYEGSGGNSGAAKKAVSATAGEMIIKNGKAIKAFFHSTCGGETESALNVWGDKAEFKTVKDPYCETSPNRTWTFSISKPEMVSKLIAANFPATTIENVQIEKRPKNARAATVVLDTGKQTLFLQSNDFRKIIGYDDLKSTWFSVQMSAGKVTFTGHGYGHGVGLCQWGAKGMAEAGKTYREILKFYYAGTKLVMSNE